VEILFCLTFGSIYLEWSAKKIATESGIKLLKILQTKNPPKMVDFV